MPRETTPAPETHCEYCGAEYALGPAAGRENAPPAAPPPEEAAAGGEPPARCEYCGAEYPLPDDDSGS